MLKIAVVGPESSGKTTLCEALMLHLRAWMVSEVAREFLGELDRPYVEADLLAIAKAQAENEDMVTGEFSGLVVCDTDMITVRIWSEEKYGRCDPWIMQQSEERHYDLWLLCKPDMPWQADPLRENPHDRDRLFGVYEGMLKWLEKPYVIMQGDREHRLADASKAIADPLRQRKV
ncbi:MAG: ATP-binding protein [Flavobacteriales bacterium]|nr:ATP-binding protein [Flavobacteriales bacterium]